MHSKKHSWKIGWAKVKLWNARKWSEDDAYKLKI